MAKKLRCLITALIVALTVTASAFSGDVSTDYNTIPKKGMVTMIDLGAAKCIPCKMMAPILTRLEKTYEGKAEIVFIDVWKNKAQANRFGVRGIPTQIFFDKYGREVYRHVGFFDEKSIIARLTEMGVKAP